VDDLSIYSRLEIRNHPCAPGGSDSCKNKNSSSWFYEEGPCRLIKIKYSKLNMKKKLFIRGVFRSRRYSVDVSLPLHFLILLK